jgi:type IV pilus assembly protein PilW
MRAIPDMTVLQRGRSRGMSLVELMVAAAIGIIASLAIFQVFAVFEGQKRTTTSGGEAQTSGTLALYTLERDVRQGGYGFNTPDLVGCLLQGWDQQAGAALTPTTLAPAFIAQGAGSTPGVAGSPDSIAVAYGNGDALPAPVTILVGSLGATDDFIRIVNALYGFQPGDHVVVAEGALPCTLAQVNQIPPATGDNTRLNLQVGSYVNASGATVNTRFNNPAGLGTTYTINGKVYNVGPAPSVKVFSILNGQLVSQALGAAAPTPVFDNIVQLQAQYGHDTNGDGVVDAYNETTPVTSTGWAAVLAIRVAIVARSSLFEKEEVSPVTIRLWNDCLPSSVPACNPPYTTGPVWTLTSDERHYRYKVFQTVIPLRNMLWRPY